MMETAGLWPAGHDPVLSCAESIVCEQMPTFSEFAVKDGPWSTLYYW
jgi:hypothetical protein